MSERVSETRLSLRGAASLEIEVQVAHWGKQEDHHILWKGLTGQDGGRPPERGDSFNVGVVNGSQSSRLEKDAGEYSTKDIKAKESAGTEYRLEAWKRK